MRDLPLPFSARLCSDKGQKVREKRNKNKTKDVEDQ